MQAATCRTSQRSDPRDRPEHEERAPSPYFPYFTVGQNRPYSASWRRVTTRSERSYSVTRHEDPALKARVLAALGDARSVLNVGAGTGSYEPADRCVIAVEP